MELEKTITVKYNPFTRTITVDAKGEISRMEIIGILAAAQQMIGFNWMADE